MARYGILTSGGDCPGLERGYPRHGVAGTAVHGQEFVRIPRRLPRPRARRTSSCSPARRCAYILQNGGTILRTSRYGPYEETVGQTFIRKVLKNSEIEGVIAVGGDGTMAAAVTATADGIPMVGVLRPSTTTWRPHRLHLRFLHRGRDRHGGRRPAADHRRLAQCLHGPGGDGRHAGWIAMYAGVAAGAHA